MRLGGSSLSRELFQLLEQSDVLSVLVGGSKLGQLVGKLLADTTLVQQVQQYVVQLLFNFLNLN